MHPATTIVFARGDLSIPGAAEDGALIFDQKDLMQAHFFELVSRSRPDVIVLDFSNRPATGTETILAIRQRTDIPILVICHSEPPEPDDYRIAGAADCIPAPVDIIRLNQTIQRIVRIRGGSGGPSLSRAPQNFAFARMSFYPRRNLLAGEHSATVDLTSSEGRLLAHFVGKPWTLCTRAEIAELLYGPQNGIGDRAIDVVVNRLRKKLILAAGADAELIKTEFRRGYLLVTDVATLPHEAPAPPRSSAEAVS